MTKNKIQLWWERLSLGKKRDLKTKYILPHVYLAITEIERIWVGEGSPELRDLTIDEKCQIAYESTYEQSINPEAIVGLRDAAQGLINYHKTLPIFDSWTHTGDHWASDDLKEVLTALCAALEKTKII